MIKFAKVIAANTDLETSQAFVYHQGESYLAILFSVVGEDVFAKVRQLAADLEGEFFDSQAALSERVERALSWLEENLTEVEQKQILVASWQDIPEAVLYLKGVGDQRAVLYRGAVIPLVSANQSGQLISGFLKSQDSLVLLNHSLASYLGSSEDDGSVESLLKVPLDDFEEEVNSQLFEHQRGEPIAAIRVDFKLEQPEESAEVPTPAEVDVPASDTPKAVSSQPEQPIPHLQDTSLASKRFPLPAFNITSLKSALVRSLPKTRKGQLYAGLVLLAILFIGIGLSVHSKGQKEKDAQFTQELTSAQNEYQNAQNLKDLDATQAEQSLAQAKTDLANALKIRPKDTEALSLQNQIQQNGNDILKLYPVSSWPLFLDLGLIKNGFSADRLSLSLGKILLLDKKQRSLVMIDLSTKNNQILAGGDQIGNPQEAALNGQNAFVYSSDKGIVRVDTQSLKVATVAKSDPDWGEITDLDGFGGNIYLLDNIKNQIWKYIATTNGYSDKNSYLRSGVKADFSGAKKILIDSSVWVLGQNSELDRYTAGSPDSYSVGGLDKPITNLTNFFISDKTQNIYLLDEGNSRLVVTSKSGQYISQYTGDKFKTASDLVVDEQGKKIYLLDANKIYSIDLH